MVRRRLIHILGVISLTVSARTLAAQCAPAVQRLLNERAFDAAKTQLDAQLAQEKNDIATLRWLGRRRPPRAAPHRRALGGAA
jgi:hypothetical protein